MTNSNNLNDIKKELQNRIKWLQPRIKESEDKLQQNFTHYFAWVCEDLWKDKFKIDNYQMILFKAENEPIDLIDVTMSKARQLAEYCTEAYNVRENSTGSLHREASTYKYIASLELLKELNKILNNKY